MTFISSQEEMMNIYAYVYCTVNTAIRTSCPYIQMYIGVHKYNGFDKNYKGSGTLLWRAIRKYGWNSFKSYMIKAFDNYEEALDYEKFLIKKFDAANYNNKMFYNILEGGGKGPEGKPRESKVWIENPSTGERTRVCPDDLTLYFDKGFVKQYHSKVHVVKGNEDLVIDYDDLDEYRSKGYSLNKGAVGPDRVWLNNGVKTVHVLKNDVKKYLSKGFSLGMLSSGPYGQKSVHDPNTGEIRYAHTDEELKKFLDKGFLPGTGTKPHLGKKLMNNGFKEVFVSPDEISLYLSNGYQLGRLRYKYMTNDKEIIRVVAKDIPLKESEGYVVCKPKHNGNSGLIVINNGITETRVHPDKLPEMLKMGYTKGRIKGGRFYTNGITNMVIPKGVDTKKFVDMGYTPGRMLLRDIEENKKSYNKLRELLELPPLNEG